MQVRRRIEVAGIVQGVGFRPYVFRLATERRLAGSIRNTPSGVAIEVQGPLQAVEEFVASLPQQAPPLARITGVQVTDLPCNGDCEFLILSSRQGETVHTLISPDIALCDDCLSELLNPGDRRYHYPFINCTNCGPRFTIVRGIPYDRPQTSMAVFRMCAACQAEYDDPRNRRFHAQPNACWDCGPRVELRDKAGNPIDTKDPIAATASALAAGQIVAIKGIGGFHLAADATNAQAVGLLRERKRRIEKPFALMVPDVAAAEALCEVDPAAVEALLSPQRPITLLPWKLPSPVTEALAPNNRYLGLFLPYTPLHHLLFAAGRFSALVMTSGNLSEEPIAIDNQEALRRLGTLADLFLVNNRDILLRCDDSVVRPRAGGLQQLRRSRGYVPVPVFLGEEIPPILAVGGELKNTICLTQGDHAFLSQHIGDLENLESYKFFEEAVHHLQTILEIKPETIAYDLHPDYFATKWALQQEGMKPVAVQHHHAHIASCMAENQLAGRVIGIALDGTGYGTDGRIWGGEVLVADYATFERVAHLEYVPLPGGAAAIHEPWRMAVSYLHHHFGREFLKRPAGFVRSLDSHKTDLLLRMIERGVNSPLTSSCGRLFDAVSALAGLRRQVNYEAQAAIELEMALEGIGDDNYPFELKQSGERWVIGTAPLFEALLADLADDVSVGVVSRRFHNGLAQVLAQVAQRVLQRTSLERICLSGGTFQNVYLQQRLEKLLQECGFHVFLHHEVPAGDGGLSLGQVLIAAHRQT
jgi:hydrogenase maturation protein HypF